LVFWKPPPPLSTHFLWVRPLPKTVMVVISPFHPPFGLFFHRPVPGLVSFFFTVLHVITLFFFPRIPPPSNFCIVSVFYGSFSDRPSYFPSTQSHLDPLLLSCAKFFFFIDFYGHPSQGFPKPPLGFQPLLSRSQASFISKELSFLISRAHTR